MIMPLSLTLLSAAVPPERRNAALGIWGAIGGVAVAIGPLVGGAITTGWAWQYIFWINVPVGVALGILAWWKLAESRGYKAQLDIRGVMLVSIGLFGVVYGLVQGKANAIAPGKRPLSSMTPTILLKDGKPVLIVGTPGGSRITTTVLQVIVNVIDHGMSLQEAIDAPRIHQGRRYSGRWW